MAGAARTRDLPVVAVVPVVGLTQVVAVVTSWPVEPGIGDLAATQFAQGDPLRGGGPVDGRLRAPGPARRRPEDTAAGRTAAANPSVLRPARCPRRRGAGRWRREGGDAELERMAISLRVVSAGPGGPGDRNDDAAAGTGAALRRS
ncbi:hypothetical protein HBB16_18270 [Pseudonocardia sp. MCCB 268]|nr:hypothetical protein [Pseudonocardia cytotoxica]